MLKCEDVRKELEAFLSNEIDEPQKSEIRDHLQDCRNCSQALRRLTKLSDVLDSWQALEPSPLMYEKLKARIKSFRNPIIRKVVFKFAEVAAIVAITLSVSHFLGKPVPKVRDDSTTINFYLKEHRDVVARHVSFSPSTPQPVQMRVNQHDILYYESFDDEPEYMNPGIIVRGPLSQGQISPSKAPVISNGHTLSLSEAKETANFDLVAPLWLHPGYELDQIRRIDGRDALQLLYTDGIKSVSLFEQPLDGQRGLGAKDFREYAVYRNAEQSAGTILTWRDHTLSYVLIGNADMSQLMEMSQSISAAR